MTYNQITLNGLDLINDNYFCTISGAFDMEKTIISNDLSIDGQSFARSKINPKSPVLNIAILRLNETNVLNINKTICKNGLKTLTLDTEEIGKISGMVEVKNRVRGDSANLLSLTLTMPAPYWYSEDAQSIELGATYSSGVIFSPTTSIDLWGAGIVFGTATGAAGIVTNYGNVVSYPKITIVGECSGMSVTNITTSQTIHLSYPLAENDVLVADFDPETHYTTINGVSHFFSNSLDLLKCVPGENVFTFARNSQENKKHCTVSLQSRWT